MFSSETSDEQRRDYGRGRGTVDCCYPVKCMIGHYGELMFGQKHKIDVLLSPMICTLPSFLHGHVVNSLSCPRVMAAPENIKGGFPKERDVFAREGIKYVSPFVSLAEPAIVPKQLSPAMAQFFPACSCANSSAAVEQGLRGAARLRPSDPRGRARDPRALRIDRQALHPGAGAALSHGSRHRPRDRSRPPGLRLSDPLGQYLPLDADLLDWLFGEDVRQGEIASAFDIRDVWPSSYSGNTNEILWAAKVAARCPWVSCVIRLTSYECGMDQPTYTPVQEIVERSGTLFFSFQDLDSTKPAGSVRIRIETIAHYLERRSSEIVRTKLGRLNAS